MNKKRCIVPKLQRAVESDALLRITSRMRDNVDCSSSHFNGLEVFASLLPFNRRDYASPINRIKFHSLWTMVFYMRIVNFKC